MTKSTTMMIHFIMTLSLFMACTAPILLDDEME